MAATSPIQPKMSRPTFPFLRLFPELQLTVLEHLPDVCTLYKLIQTCKPARELYAKNAFQILRAIHRNSISQATGNDHLINDAIAAHFSSRSLVCSVGTNFRRLEWKIPTTDQLWSETPRDQTQARARVQNQPFGILQQLASLRSEVEGLTAWCYEHYGPASGRPANPNTPSNLLLDKNWSRSDIQHALRHLMLYIQRFRQVRTQPYGRWFRSVLVTHLQQPDTVPAPQVVDIYLNSFDLRQLELLSDVLEMLEEGYCRARRHQLLPRKGSLLHELFEFERSGGAGCTYHLKEKMRGRLPVKLSASISDAVAALRARGRKPNSEYGVLALEDFAERESHGLGDAVRGASDYMEKMFRPLLGLPFGSPVAVEDLVGVVGDMKP